MESKRAKELAESHWNGYVGPLISVVLTQRDYTHDEVLEMCRYNYISSHIHGFKHGVESERAGEFRPRIGEVAQYAPAHPYLHKDEVPVPCGWSYQGSCTFTTECEQEYVYEGPIPDTCPACGRRVAIVDLPSPLSPSEAKALADSISPPSLCGTCIRQGCPVDCAEHTTECGEYLPSEGEKDLCRKCVNSECHSAGRKMNTDSCVNYYDNLTMAAAPSRTKPTSGRFSYNFPAAEKFIGCQVSEYLVKLREEVNEVSDAETPQDRVIELLDVIHAAETAIRSQVRDYGLDIQDLADHVVAKNKIRNYYTKD